MLRDFVYDIDALCILFLIENFVLNHLLKSALSPN